MVSVGTIILAECLMGILAILVGLGLLLCPQKAIKMQEEFYRHINWNIAPISLDKEIRNTRIMGVICLICGVLIFLIAQRTQGRLG